MNCDVCGLEIEAETSGWDKGHNPAPLLKTYGARCCNWCNENLVTPLRIRLIKLSPEYRRSRTVDEV